MTRAELLLDRGFDYFHLQKCGFDYFHLGIFWLHIIAISTSKVALAPVWNRSDKALSVF